MNFTIAMLDEAVRVCPEPLITNQVEYHAYLPQDRMLAALKTARHDSDSLLPDDWRQVAQQCPRHWRNRQGARQVNRPNLFALADSATDGGRGASATRRGAYQGEALDVFDWSLSNEEMRRIFSFAQPPHPHRRPAGTRASSGTWRRPP